MIECSHSFSVGYTGIAFYFIVYDASRYVNSMSQEMEPRKEKNAKKGEKYFLLRQHELYIFNFIIVKQMMNKYFD